MNNFKKNKNMLPIPWVESPFFYSILENSKMSNEDNNIKTYLEKEPKR